jgi:eukaryotic-like serine/threonine-protein kinase
LSCFGLDTMLELGEILEGKYRILRLLGEGGMGSVFEGEAIRLRRRVAIKVLRDDHSTDHETELAARFQLEAQAAGRIGSRHVVDVLDLGRLPSGAPFMVMEYLDGESLRSRIASQAPMAPADLYPILLQLLEGVGAAHTAHVIHRDLKPDNIFLVKQADGGDFVKLVDFGISKFRDEGAVNGDGLALTQTGAMMGTPYYLAPEQANGSSPIDERTDLYALGVVLYECLTGNVPYSASGFNELLFRIVLDQPTSIRQLAPNADPAFVSLVERAMHKKPAERFQSAAEMSRAFQAWANGVAYEAPRGVTGAHRALGAPAGSARFGNATVADGDHQTSNPALQTWSHSQLSEAASVHELPRNKTRYGAWLALGAVLVCAVWLLVRWSRAEPVAATPASSASAASLTPAVVGATPPAIAELALPAPQEAERLPLVTSTEPAPPLPPRSPEPTAKRSRPPRVAGKVTPSGAPSPAVQPQHTEPAPADTDVSRIRSGRTIRTDL